MTTHDIFITENDISELAQAKAAHIAGVLLLLRAYGIDLDRLERFYLAGGFAQYINVQHAMGIGLIPRMPVEKVEKIGNAAIEGATAVLCSTDVRGRIERLVRRIEHVELETIPEFFSYFVEGCQFKDSEQMSHAHG